MAAESPRPASRPTEAVFLSYASEDAEAAKRICDALRAAGIEVWFDQSELRGGDAWDRKIRDQIQDCRLFIPVISANTESRDEGYFRREWRLGVERAGDMVHKRTFLVPVVIDGTSERGAAVPEKFQELQWTRLPGGETPPEFVQRVAALVGPAGGSDAAVPSLRAGLSGVTARVARAPASRARDRRWPYTALIGALVAGAIALMLVRPWRSLQLPSTNTPAPVAVAEKSVAVLPFTDLSEKKDQEYFADGLTEEIIDILTRVPGLRVPARTSAFYFKGKNVPISEIARALNVATVLEGSVRKSGNHYRITAQLIRGDTGAHVWSKTFDREATNVFDVSARPSR